LTILYVTHDQTEALALSTSVAVLRDGRVEQMGTPREIYERPQTRFVADFVGKSNFLDAKVVEVGVDGTCSVDTSIGRVLAHATGNVTVGSRAEVVVRPERLVIHRGDAGADRPNRAAGTVASATYLGESLDYQIALTGGVEVAASSHPSVEAVPGDRVTVEFPVSGCSIVPAE
jgi:iron(III) transport system ATP-binding protein